MSEAPSHAQIAENLQPTRGRQQRGGRTPAALPEPSLLTEPGVSRAPTPAHPQPDHHSLEALPLSSLRSPGKPEEPVGFCSELFVLARVPLLLCFAVVKCHAVPVAGADVNPVDLEGVEEAPEHRCCPASSPTERQSTRAAPPQSVMLHGEGSGPKELELGSKPSQTVNLGCAQLWAQSGSKSLDLTPHGEATQRFQAVFAGSHSMADTGGSKSCVESPKSRGTDCLSSRCPSP